MPLWIVAIPILGAVGFVVYEATTAVMNWLDPKVKRAIYARYERKTGQKWEEKS